MATYECKICGMSVNATCGHCDAPLENDNLKLPDGREVQISAPERPRQDQVAHVLRADMSCSIG
jgi:hypothetical protein